jgi:tetratricopeptide (TPR) repeat protein
MSSRWRYQAIQKWLIVLWLLIPVALLSYHFGPGQRELAWREAGASYTAAAEYEQQQHWEQAIDAYGQALNTVPTTAEDVSAATLARDQLRLAQLRAAFQLGKLDDTLTDTRQFVEHVESTHGAESSLAYDARDFLGRVHYQAMIALRLESAEKQVWMKHWELARQNFRFLAEHSPSNRNELDRQNLEIVIKSANLPTPLPPPTGGGAGGASTATLTPPTTTPPPPIAGAGKTVTPDSRPRTPTLNNGELTPPEFEKGS